jgi:hypothetical protein
VQKLPDAITLVEKMDYKTQGVIAIIVALCNKEVRIYRGKCLINLLQVDVRKEWSSKEWSSSTFRFMVETQLCF